MPRQENADLAGYRYGFNGMEKDDEVYGEGNSYTTEFRQLDVRLGRWLSLDPVVHHNMSPYVTFDNNPIWIIDPSGADGEEGGKDVKASQLESDLSLINEAQEDLNQQKEKLEKVFDDYDELINTIEAAEAIEAGLLLKARQGDVRAAAAAAVIALEIGVSYMVLEGMEEDIQERLDTYNKLADVTNQFIDIVSNDLAKAETITFDVSNSHEGVAKAGVGAGLIALHKNNNAAVGNFAIYEIQINGEHYKFGKADMDRRYSTGEIKRLESQVRKLSRTYGAGNVQGRVISTHKNTSVATVKKIETAHVNNMAAKRGFLSHGNRGHKRKGGPDVGPKPSKRLPRLR